MSGQVAHDRLGADVVVRIDARVEGDHHVHVERRVPHEAHAACDSVAPGVVEERVHARIAAADAALVPHHRNGAPAREEDAGVRLDVAHASVVRRPLGHGRVHEILTVAVRPRARRGAVFEAVEPEAPDDGPHVHGEVVAARRRGDEGLEQGRHEPAGKQVDVHDGHEIVHWVPRELVGSTAESVAMCDPMKQAVGYDTGFPARYAVCRLRHLHVSPTAEPVQCQRVTPPCSHPP